MRRWFPSHIILTVALLSSCGDGNGGTATARQGRYVLAAVVIDAEGTRTTYVQTVRSLDEGPFDNKAALELPGNGVVMAAGKSFYVGLADAPTWIRYSIDDSGSITESGRLSLLGTGASRIDYGNAIVDAETAVSVLSAPPLVVVWNPSTLTLRGEIDLGHLVRAGYELEVWTTAAHDGRVYIPGRWADWEGGRIFPGVSTTIIDPKAMTIAGVAEDDRCASGGRVVFGEDGSAYVMGDGRNYSIQMFANAAGTAAPDNCLLRIPPGATHFDPGYFHKIPALTGGRQSITELETARQGSGLAFAKMFYPERLPATVTATDFDFWGEQAHKMWRLHLTDPPSAEEVEGIPFSTIGFEGSVLDDHLYTGESPDGNTSDVYEIDPNTNTARLRFTMDGYFNGLYKLDN